LWPKDLRHANATCASQGAALDIPKSGFFQLLKWEVHFLDCQPNHLAILAILTAFVAGLTDRNAIREYNLNFLGNTKPLSHTLSGKAQLRGKLSPAKLRWCFRSYPIRPNFSLCGLNG
jgi:hypothetical protein